MPLRFVFSQYAFKMSWKLISKCVFFFIYNSREEWLTFALACSLACSLFEALPVGEMRRFNCALST